MPQHAYACRLVFLFGLLSECVISYPPVVAGELGDAAAAEATSSAPLFPAPLSSGAQFLGAGLILDWL